MIRILDVFFSIIALVIFAPILLPIILTLACTGEGKVFYLQERVGKNGTTFKIIKLATMYADSPHMGSGTITIKDDPRILPFGKYLRKTKINEFTQLLNVVFGDMSLIGPRPLTKENFNYYCDEAAREIIKMRPGVSGIGSIIFRSEEKLLTSISDYKEFYKNVIAPYKGELEIWYVKNANLGLYMLTIALTVVTLVFPENRLIWSCFKSLPKPTGELKQFIRT